MDEDMELPLPVSANTGTTPRERMRRHHWINKYEVDFGLQVVERHPHTGEVMLAVCGLCKAFGREIKDDSNADSEESPGVRKRRRGLTTTKYFRSFRVDNIRSHLVGAHPQRWEEYQAVAKQEDLRRAFLASGILRYTLVNAAFMSNYL
jgi:hypothetical protein